VSRQVLIAGVGNIFCGDDGFGSEVVRRLAEEPLPPGVEVVDYGIRGVHLVFDLLEGCPALVLVDAAPRGGRPGSVYVLEVGPDDLGEGSLDAHSMDPAAVLASLSSLGGTWPRTFVVGCEPAELGERIGLSPAATAAVDVAVSAVRELVADELAPLGAREGG
jgi:hydrogenase maturation protease